MIQSPVSETSPAPSSSRKSRFMPSSARRGRLDRRADDREVDRPGARGPRAGVAERPPGDERIDQRIHGAAQLDHLVGGEVHQALLDPGVVPPYGILAAAPPLPLL